MSQFKTYQVEVWGDYACFTRPEFKSERASYEVMTPAAARGILEAIYRTPGFDWVVDRIYVLNPIKMVTIRTNENKSKVLVSALKLAHERNNLDNLYQNIETDRTQRASLVLKDVRYVIEAHFVLRNLINNSNAAYFSQIFEERLENGACFYRPYLGCREYAAQFAKWEGGTIPSIPVTKDLGYMHYDFCYEKVDGKVVGIKPIDFEARLERGVLDLTGARKEGENKICY